MWVLFGLLTVAVVACAAHRLPTATQADAARAQQRWPGVTVAELERGRTLYAARCGSCHQPVQPTRVAPAEWPGHVDEMRERAHLAPGEAALVKQYLVLMSERATW